MITINSKSRGVRMTPRADSRADWLAIAAPPGLLSQDLAAGATSLPAVFFIIKG